MIYYLETFYLAIANLLLSDEANELLEANNLPAIKHIDLFNSQYKYEELEIAYALPAIFIEMAEAGVAEKGRLDESRLETIRIHIEQKQLASTAFNSYNRPKALESLRLVDAVHLILKGYEGTYWGKMRLVSRELETDHGINPVHIYTYTSQFVYDGTDKLRSHSTSTPGADALNISKS
ncbi:MAG: hypothetical protein NW226_17590 [Microscillaceae bacterium]|nr:hypothetical protein [Microscillaceae bacterium]